MDATQPGQPVRLHVDRLGSHVQVLVVDDGPGMSREFVRDELFRPFRSTKNAGMGLGAYESQQYVNELGGKIEVDSVPGQGTEVKIQLPLLDRSAAPDLDILKPVAGAQSPSVPH
jgi:signal transduction histidine kinase